MTACLISNSLEFEGIETTVVDALPDSKEEDGAFVLEPLLDEGSRAIEVPHHVSERNVVAVRLRQDSNGCSLDFR